MRKITLSYFFFFIVLSFSVTAICCTQGCYPDANCCGGVDGIGYVGCEATGSVFYCPQDDSVEGTVLEECLNCLCSDTYTCEWEMYSMCSPGEICLTNPGADDLPESSLCVNENCPECGDCSGFGCSLEECHGCYNGQCYFTSLLGYASCHDCPGSECSDYGDDPNACNGEITDCVLGTSCYWTGSSCNQCTDTKCEDYTDTNTCYLDPCNIRECLWYADECFTIQPGFCNNNGVANRGETCDCGGGSCSAIQLNYKTCEDFGFDGGSLGCSNCEYVFSDCDGYDPRPPSQGGKCGDKVLDLGKEACDCGGSKICTSMQLNRYTCQNFDQFNGGILSCYEDCTLDTRSCRVCDKDGVRDLGETCDCGSGICNAEQLNYKSCNDFAFSGGILGCDGNCEYEFSSCNGYAGTPPTCGDGFWSRGAEACDCGGVTCNPTQLNNKVCNDFDYYTGGTLQCTDTCEFNTMLCNIPGPDESYFVCELKEENYQGNCSKQGDHWCWDSNVGDGECCGDGMNDKWVDYLNNSCCQESSGRYVFQNDADYSSCFCNVMGEKFKGTDAEVCDIINEMFCWSSTISPKDTGRCCGDDKDEIWNYSSSLHLDDVLVRETCYKNSWRKRSELNYIWYYDLSAGLIR